MNYFNELIRLNYRRCGILLLDDDIQLACYDFLDEIALRYLEEYDKNEISVANYQIFEDNYDSLENSIIVSFCSKKSRLKIKKLEILHQLYFGAFEIVWADRYIKKCKIASILSMMKKVKDKAVYIKLFDLILDCLYLYKEQVDENLKTINNSRSLKSERNKDLTLEDELNSTKRSNKIELLIFELIDLYKLKGGNDEILQKIENFEFAERSHPTIVLLKNILIIYKFNQTLSFRSLANLNLLFNHLNAYLNIYEKIPNCLEECTKNLIPIILKSDESEKFWLGCENKYISTISNLNKKSRIIESIALNNEINLLSFIDEVNLKDIYNQVLLYLAYNCMKSKLEAFIKLGHASKNIKEKINIYAAYGRNWNKYALKISNFKKKIEFTSKPLFNEEILLEMSFKPNFLITLGFLGDNLLLSCIDKCDDLSLLIKICIEVVKGYHYTKKHCYGKMQDCIKGHKNIINYFESFFESKKFDKVENTLLTTNILKIFIKYRLIDLLLNLISLLNGVNKQFSMILFYKIYTSSSSIYKKIETFERMKKIELSPYEFFKNIKSKNLKIFKDSKILIYFFENFPELECFIQNFIKYIGDFGVMQKYNQFSYKGVCRFGTKIDFDEYLKSFPKNINLIEFCKLAIKARNKDVSCRCIELMNENECLKMLSLKDFEIFSYVAFYCLDDIIQSLVYKLGADFFKTLKSKSLSGFTFFDVRIINGMYSEVWEPLSYAFNNLVENRISFIHYIQKYLEFKLKSRLWFYIPNNQYKNDLSFIDSIHKELITMEDLDFEIIIPYYLSMNLVPSSRFLKEIIRLNLEIAKIYLGHIFTDCAKSKNKKFCNMISDWRESINEINFEYANQLSLLGNASIIKLQNCTSKIDKMIIRNLLICGRLGLFLYRYTNLALSSRILDDIYELFDRNIKKSIVIAIFLVSRQKK